MFSKNVRIGLGFILVLMSHLVQGQQLTPEVYDFGKVKMWNNPVATFAFTNTSAKPIIFLPLSYQPEVQIDLPENYIQPGQTVEIKVKFYTQETGQIRFQQPLYYSGSGEPIFVRLAGKIVSLHPNAITSCPSMNEKSPAQITQEGHITSFNAEDGLAINGVSILLESSTQRFVIENSKSQRVPVSEMPPGLYTVTVSKLGFEPQTKILYINNNSGDFTFHLKPVPSSEASELNTPQDKPSDDPVELDPPTQDEDAIERVREMMNERFKDRQIRERDVLVIRDKTEEEEEDDDLLSSDEWDNVPDSKDTTTPDESVTASTPNNEEDFGNDGVLNPNKYRYNNVVFLVDVSTSMKINGRLDLMKTAMKELVSVLRHEDLVTIISYSSKTKILIASTPGDQKEMIYAIIDSLEAKGNSYGHRGLERAYEFALNNYIKEGNNQVILASDGLFNSKEVTEKEIFEMAENNSILGVRTSVVGFGKSKEALKFLKRLSANGRGSFIRITSETAAQSALVEEIMKNAIKL